MESSSVMACSYISDKCSVLLRYGGTHDGCINCDPERKNILTLKGFITESELKTQALHIESMLYQKLNEIK